jgi:outer membrane protein
MGTLRRVALGARTLLLGASAAMPAPRIAYAQTRVLTLAEIELAARRQPQLLAAGAVVDSARGQAQQARAPLLPQVTLNSHYTRETGNFAPSPLSRNHSLKGGTTLTPSFDYWQFDFGVTQLVYDFGQASQRYQAAERAVDAQQCAVRTALVQVTFAVRRAYFNAGAARELVGVAKERLDDETRHLAQVQGFIDAGTQPPIALAQQESAVANAEVQLVQAKNDYEVAKAQVNQAAGLEQGTDYDVAAEMLGPIADENDPSQTLTARAIATRPEIAVLERQREGQVDTIHSAEGGYGPTLSVSAGGSEYGLAFDQLIPNWYGGVTVNWPVFQGGLTQGQVSTAQANLRNLESQERLEKLQIRFDVDSSRLAVIAANAAIPAANRSLVSARERLALAEERYATGVGSIIELDDAQVAHTYAAVQAVDARYALSSARAQLLAALGRI